MSGVHRDTQGEADKRGHRVIWPEPCELFIDIDSEHALTRFEERFALLTKSVGRKWAHVIRPSATLGHYHVTVTMHRPVTSEVERILLQLILGSDSNRELFSWVRHELDARPVSCFFEPIPTLLDAVFAAVDPPPALRGAEGVAGYDLVPPGYR